MVGQKFKGAENPVVWDFKGNPPGCTEGKKAGRTGFGSREGAVKRGT